MAKKGYSYPIERKYREIEYLVLLGVTIVSYFLQFVNSIRLYSSVLFLDFRNILKFIRIRHLHFGFFMI